MLQDRLDNIYFDWLYNLVCGTNTYTSLTYRKLLIFLHNVEFTYLLEMDSNRAQDGIDFRYRFGYENNYAEEDISIYLDNRPCSVLEMMVALAFKVEEQIMDDDEYGNRTGQWFWNMIVSLGLGSYNDRNFNRIQANRIITIFLNRDYEPNGHGGLFTIENCKDDLRTVEIWSQCMWYLDEIIGI